MIRDLAKLPKGHLHVHLEGAMRPSTLADLSHKYGIPMPSVNRFGTFSEFANMYVAACNVLKNYEDLQRVVREIVEDNAIEGVVWVEPALYPLRHSASLGPPEDVIDAVLEAGLAAANSCGVGFGLMVAADRTRDITEASNLAKLAASRKDRSVVSFGLANDEAASGPEPFAEAFRIARAAGLLSTPHAGELAGSESVLGALDLLKADRIQHGVRAIEDFALISRLVDAGTCLDVCLTSNLLLSVVPSLAEHPLPALLRAGVRCSVNADDPLLFGSSLLSEYYICRNVLGLGDDDIAEIARSSIECSGGPLEMRGFWSAKIDDWLSGDPSDE